MLAKDCRDDEDGRRGVVFTSLSPRMKVSSGRSCMRRTTACTVATVSAMPSARSRSQTGSRWAFPMRTTGAIFPPTSALSTLTKREPFGSLTRWTRKWWVEMDSNQRKLTLADLQSAPFSHSGIYPFPARRGGGCMGKAARADKEKMWPPAKKLPSWSLPRAKRSVAVTRARSCQCA